MTDEPHPLGLGKVCPSCGARSNTLGGICPACRRPYVRGGGLLERIPFVSSDPVGRYRLPIAGLFLLLWLFAGWLWLLIEHPIAGIVVAGFAFVGLVAAIGAANALDERR